MSLATRPAPEVFRRGPQCLACRIFADRDPAEWATVERWHADGATWPAISEAIAADDDYPVKIPADTLARHARGRCRR